MSIIMFIFNSIPLSMIFTIMIIPVFFFIFALITEKPIIEYNNTVRMSLTISIYITTAIMIISLFFLVAYYIFDISYNISNTENLLKYLSNGLTTMLIIYSIAFTAWIIAIIEFPSKDKTKIFYIFSSIITGLFCFLIFQIVCRLERLEIFGEYSKYMNMFNM